MATTSLSKIDAATRQLNTAIEMWFRGDDSVSVHTLACASHQLIHDANSKRKGPPMMFDSPLIRDEHRGIFIQAMRREYDFFRHADRAPEDARLDFDEDFTEPFLFISCCGLQSLGIEHDVTRTAMVIYFALRFPDVLSDEGQQHLIERIPIDTIDKMRSIERREFFEAYKLLRERHG